MIFQLFFVNLQLISLTQLAIHDIRKETEAKFIYSYLMSILIVSLIITEILRGWQIMNVKCQDP